MWRLVVGALRARRGQSSMLFLLAALAVAASTAAPLYADAAGRAARLDEVRAATGADRTVSVRNDRAPADPRAIDTTRESLRGAARGSGLTDILALDLSATLSVDSVQTTLIAREGICEHVVVTGRCAREAGEATVSEASRWRVGDEISTADPPLRLRVVGAYRMVDVGEPYWAGRLDLDTDPTIVTARTLFDARPAVLGVTVDLVALDPSALAVGPGLTEAVLAIQRATPSGYAVSTGLPGLVERVEANRRALVNGVVIGTGQLILICVFVLLLAVGQASAERRGEFAVAALRGAPARHRFILIVSPSAVPLVAAAPIGFAAGWFVAWASAGPAGIAPVAMTPATYALAGTTVLVALAAAVAGALRGAPRGRKPYARRADLVDLIVVVLAGGAAYQLGSGRATAGGLAAFTPMLVSLACGLVAARLVLPVVAAGGTRWLHRGRLVAGLAALQLARRPTGHRLLAMVAVATARRDGRSRWPVRFG